MIVQIPILDVVQQKLSGRFGDIVNVVEMLLQLAQQAGEIHCTPAPNDHIRFEVRGQGTFEIEALAAKSRVRTMCARLAVLCQESGHEFLPYGGEGTIRNTWKARWTNTTDKQEFTLVAE